MAIKRMSAKKRYRMANIILRKRYKNAIEMGGILMRYEISSGKRHPRMEAVLNSYEIETYILENYRMPRRA